MNSYVHQYPAALFSVVSDTGFRHEANTGEVLRSGRGERVTPRRRLFGWLRPSSNGPSSNADGSQPSNRLRARPTPAPHHFELKFHRERHAR
jgi:hypothetical protein